MLFLFAGNNLPVISDTYSVFRDPETFADAEQHCRDHGGTLATIANKDQMDQLSALLFQAYDPFGKFRLQVLCKMDQPIAVLTKSMILWYVLWA